MERTTEFPQSLHLLPSTYEELGREYRAIPEFVTQAQEQRSGFLFTIMRMVDGGVQYEDLLALDAATLKFLDDHPDGFMELQEAYAKVVRSQALDRVILARIFGTEKF